MPAKIVPVATVATPTVPLLRDRLSRIHRSTEITIMQSALRTQTTILPGHRLEITAPELPEGATVEVIVVLPVKAEQKRISMLELVETLPAGPRAFPTWEE